MNQLKAEDALRLNQAVALAENGQQAAAIAIFDQLVIDYPMEYAPRFSRALALWECADLQRSSQELERLQADFSVHPDRADFHRLAGHVASDLEHYEKAALHYQQCSQEEPHNAALLVDLAKSLFLSGRLGAALESYERASQQPEPPLESDWMWEKAAAHCALAQWPQAAQACRSFFDSAGWNHDLSPYAAVYWAIAQTEQHARLLAECPDGWPRPVLQALLDKLTPSGLLELAENDIQSIEASTYLGLSCWQAGDLKQALQWLQPLRNQPINSIFELAVAQTACEQLIVGEPPL